LAKQTFGSAHLGDQRRTERAVKIAEAMAHEPAASLPGQLHSEGEVHAAYRFLQQPDVSYEELMRPHVQQTREALGKPARVLLI